MGSPQFRMQSSTITLSLLLLLLHQGEATVSSCLTCTSGEKSPDPDCLAGNAIVNRTTCVAPDTERCYVIVSVGAEEGHLLMRGCCSGNDCLDGHIIAISGSTVDAASCDTDNCNTMDPRTSNSATTSLSILAVVMSTLSLVIAPRD